MTAKVEKRKSVIINTFYFILVFGAAYLFMRYAFWPIFPFLLSFFVAMMLQKPVNAIVKKTPLKKGFVSLIFVLLLLAVAAGLLVLLGAKIFNQAKDFVGYLTKTFDSIPDFINQAEAWLLKAAERLPHSLQNALTANIESLADKLLASFSDKEAELAAGEQLTQSQAGFDFSSLITPLTGVISKASKLPSIIVAIVVGIIACCFITTDYAKITSFIRRQLPAEKSDALSRTKQLTLRTIGKMMKAYFIIIIITCTEISIGLSLLKLIGVYTGEYILLIASIIALVDILPILGSGTVLVPWSIVSFIMGNTGMGIGLLVIYATISVLRQFIEPRLVAGQLGLPPIVTLFGMYFGLKLLGVIGMFIVPITVNVLKVLNDDGVINIWKRKDDEQVQQLDVKLPKLDIKKKKGKNANEQNHSAK